MFSCYWLSPVRLNFLEVWNQTPSIFILNSPVLIIKNPIKLNKEPYLKGIKWLNEILYKKLVKILYPILENGMCRYENEVKIEELPVR